jgi:hypothetical protein
MRAVRVAGAMVALATILCMGCASTSSLMSNPLISSLSSGLGINPTQAIQGAGSLFSLAKEKISKADFKALGKAVPGVDGMMKEAGKLGLPKPIGNVNGLNPVFQKIGMSTDQVGKMINQITGSVEQSGNKETADKLRAAWQ